MTAVAFAAPGIGVAEALLFGRDAAGRGMGGTGGGVGGVGTGGGGGWVGGEG